MTNLFSHACPTRAPGDQTRIGNILNTLLVGPATIPAPSPPPPKDKEDNDGWTEVGKSGKQKGRKGSDKEELPISLSSLVLSPMELISESYMVPSYLQSPNSAALPAHVTQDISITANGWNSRGGVPLYTSEWVETPLYDPSSNGHGGNTDANGSGNVNGDHAGARQEKAFAVDCEMVQTDEGKELARVCVVDYWTREVVYDQLVKPARPILDYLTQYAPPTSLLFPFSSHSSK